MPPDESWASNLEPALLGFLPQQRWFPSDRELNRVTVVRSEVWRPDPLLIWVLFEVETAGSTNQTSPEMYQVIVGGRDAGQEWDFLKGKERLTLGEAEGLVLYDALIDPELALDVLRVVAPSEQARIARPLLVEQSNTSVVYDERLILKLFRHLHRGPNPDVKVNQVLSDQGFPHVVPQRAALERDGMDLAVVRDYMLASTDAWGLVQTSLRDLLGSRLPPEESGGDFAADARTLGRVTGKLHVALAEAFDVEAADPDAWLADMRAQAERVSVPGWGSAEVVDALTSKLSNLSAEDAGVEMRIHGDLHLGQLLLTDTGWCVLDFEGEPNRPLEERCRPSSPLRDLAGMLRSFSYAARAVLVERGRDVDAGLAKLTEAWEQRAVDSFKEGYLGVQGVDDLLPASEIVRRRVLSAFELDKAVYEVGYEQAHRPNWVDIPVAAIDRLLAT